MKNFPLSSRRIALIALAVLALLVILWVIFSQNRQQTEYLSAKATRGDIEETVLATGKLQAFKSVDVGAQVSGQISKLNVAIGDTVKQGDVLAQIDPRTQNNQLQIAQASLQSHRAALLTQQANLTQAQQQLTRQQNMFAAGATSKEALQSAQATFKTAQAAVTQAKAQITQSQVNVETAKLNLGYTTVVAPIDGTVVAVPVEEGQTLNAGLNTPTMVMLAQLDKMTIKAEIAEADITRVKPGMNAYFTLLGNHQQRYDAILRSIDPGPRSISDSLTSSGDSAAIYYYGLLDVPNPDGVLRIDMTANVVIVIAKKTQVLKIPATALKSDGKNGHYTVEVLDKDRKPHTQTVTIGMSDGVSTEILSGLNEGDEVVIGTGSNALGKMPDRMPRR